MSTPNTDATAFGTAAPDPTSRPQRRRWVWPAATAGALVLGVAMGGGGSASSTELDAVTAERDTLAQQLETAEAAVKQAEDELSAKQEDIDAQAAELEARSAALDEREAAITQTEAAVAASQIGIGTWTVGIDIEPGTYRTAEPVASTCYWGIYRSGTNGGDIIENDIVQGGHPTVTLQAGQDFENGCGVFVKQ